jgi:hypothetical protein
MDYGLKQRTAITIPVAKKTDANISASFSVAFFLII